MASLPVEDCVNVLFDAYDRHSGRATLGVRDDSDGPVVRQPDVKRRDIPVPGW
jgi:hypothetical protein